MEFDVRGFLPLDILSGRMVMSVNPAFMPGEDEKPQPGFSGFSKTSVFGKLPNRKHFCRALARKNAK